MGRSSNENIMPDNTFGAGWSLGKFIVINSGKEGDRV
jgi:hypothetical protein